MPLVRIDLNQDKYDKEMPAKIGDLVYEAMEQELNVPKDDKFQIITRHNESELNYAKSYLGIDYSDGIVFIQITLNDGREVDLKKKLYARIANDLNQILDIRKQDVFIILVEVKKENWSFGNGEAQYAK